MTTAPASLLRRSAVELVGSGALAAVVVGSGIAAARLSDDAALQLLVNAAATALALFVLITVLGPLSGAQLNPLVTLADLVLGSRPRTDVMPYIVAQILGCVLGTMLANAMFELPPATWSSTERVSPGHLLAEVVATAGLVFAVVALARTGRAHLAAGVVAAYIGAAYFFTSSTSFANPAITVGRMLTDTFAGIAPSSAPHFVVAQLVGAAIGCAGVVLAVPRPARD